MYCTYPEGLSKDGYIITGPEEANFLWSGHFEMVCTHDLHYVYRCDRPPPSMIIILFNDIVIT